MPPARFSEAPGESLVQELRTTDRLYPNGGPQSGKTRERLSGPPGASHRIDMVQRAGYEVLSLLGQGGFGTVYKARRIATGQDVAVKIPRLQLEGPSAGQHYARFQRETALCASLHHPNIVRLIESGETDEGLFFSVFDYVPGEDLAVVLKKGGALDPEDARHLMAQVLKALRWTHARGVIHRDIKPANIMVVPAGARSDAVIIDFGISAGTSAGCATPWQCRDRRDTLVSSAVLGTPGYGAPEQFEGGPPSPRSDLYAWGLVFIECLTGAPVFAGSPLRELLLRQTGADAVPTPRALHEHPLGAILRRVTEKQIDARNVTAQEILREVEACDLKGLTREVLAVASAHDRCPDEVTDDSRASRMTTPRTDVATE